MTSTNPFNTDNVMPTQVTVDPADVLEEIVNGIENLVLNK